MRRIEFNFGSEPVGSKRQPHSVHCSGMLRRLFLSRAIIRMVMSIVLSSLCAFAGDLTIPAPPKKQSISDIPFSLRQGYLIVVEGRLGNLDHQNLLIDTGTSPSMIDKSIAEKLGLRGVPGDLSLFNKQLAAEMVMLSEVQLGPLHRSNLPVMVTEFSKIARSLGTRIDAVIGLDVLGAMSFTIDYQKSRILFRASQERHVASFAAGPQFLTVNLTTHGKELHLLLDTGTPRLVLFRDALRDLDYDWSAVTGTGENVSGTVSFGTIVLPQARLGREDVGPQRVSIIANQKGADANYDGLIGLALLRPKQISFDFERQILGWTN